MRNEQEQRAVNILLLLNGMSEYRWTMQKRKLVDDNRPFSLVTYTSVSKCGNWKYSYSYGWAQFKFIRLSDEDVAEVIDTKARLELEEVDGTLPNGPTEDWRGYE